MNSSIQFHNKSNEELICELTKLQAEKLELQKKLTDLNKTEFLLKQAKERAEESEIRFKAISENALEGITLADIDGNYVFINEAFSKMVGYSKQELLQMSLFDLKSPQERDSTLFHFLIQNARKNIGKFSRTKLLCKNGLTIYVDINATLLDIGNEKFALGIIRDVSEITKWENELLIAKEKAEESENRFRTIAEQTTEGITLADLEGNYVYVNNAFCEMSGYSKEELLQMTVFDMGSKQIKQDDDAYFREENVSGQKRNIVLRKKDGTDYYTEISGTYIELNKQKLILGTIRDISEIIKYQDELITAKDKAVQSDRLKSAFLMNVSHEIRTPMNGILGFIDLMNQPDLDEEERRSFIDIVNKSGERLLNTINDIVEISKIEIGDIHLVTEEVDLTELMKFHYNFFTLQAKEKNIEFKINKQLKGKQSTIKTDKQKLDGILMNLIRNAIKFTTKGTIEIGNYIENGRLYFFVSDSGRGIPEDKLETIFDRFVQVELGNTRGYEGSGIGLSIVKAYIEALNGDIEVKSELGKGSTFLFSLPYSPVHSKSKIIEKDRTNKVIPLKHTILVAEDDEVNFYFLEKILSKEFKLLHAENGEETLQLFKDNPEISLVLMDIKMPGEFDGFDITQKIREINSQIPVIAQTAYAMESDKIKALEAGCNDYISKPYNPGNLKQLIRQYCYNTD
ncbi:MAG TPA: PAS domain S-box protein [Draconibacterium sp.]|nr:PAS domain S-box protein [Draconibacterium sp.]